MICPILLPALAAAEFTIIRFLDSYAKNEQFLHHNQQLYFIIITVSYFHQIQPTNTQLLVHTVQFRNNFLSNLNSRLLQPICVNLSFYIILNTEDTLKL